jgi:hypothetical protein
MASKTLNEIGCEYGRMYSLNFNNFKNDVNKRFDDVEVTLKEIKEQNTELFNHQSSRIPKETVKEMMDQANKIKWLYGILGAIIGGVIVGGAIKLLFS